jgi:hypothetical protein
MLLKVWLVIFLALLQLVAPLVHAHAGERIQTSESGIAKLHIPGLETYAEAKDQLQTGTTSHSYNVEGFIISVDAGIKHKPVKLISEPADNNYALLLETLVFEPALSRIDNNLSPEVPFYPSGHLITSHSPRAPPSLQKSRIRV